MRIKEKRRQTIYSPCSSTVNLALNKYNKIISPTLLISLAGAGKRRVSLSSNDGEKRKKQNLTGDRMGKDEQSKERKLG